MKDAYEPVKVSRTIEAGPAVIFRVLADPARHHEFDGSGMLRAIDSNAPITGVGDEFRMNMFFERFGGPYEMLNRVVEFEPDRRISWAPAPADDKTSDGREEIQVGRPIGHRWSYELVAEGPGSTIVTETYDCEDAPKSLRKAVDGGKYWEDSMTRSLALLDDLCTGGTAE
jgi:uncharacterized protein YndB with AHSA1/START domain